VDVYEMVGLLLPSVELSAGQLAQVRALNHRYQTALFQRPTKSAMADVRASIASDLREMLAVDQRTVFDRNLARLRDLIIGGRADDS
jgi:hypothetical protein